MGSESAADVSGQR